jgi:hypothetical protein
MENLPEEPEKQIENPICFDCPSCKASVTSDYNNTLYVRYEKERYFNHLRVLCEEDGFTAIIWVEDKEDEEYANQYMLYQPEGGYCDDEDIIEMKNERDEIEPVAVYELTPRQEKLVEFLGHVLANTPDEQILQELSEPAPKPTLPNKWI